MAVTLSTPGFAATPFRDWIAGFGAGVSMRAERALDRAARGDRIAELDAHTTEALARMGLTRDAIPAFVFRDKFCY